MDQRQLRLGDIIDDYCPRERRITNHAVAVILDDQIKQTRCTTCENEHVYKHAKVPSRRKKKDSPAALYEEVLAGRSDEPVTQPPSIMTPDEQLPAPAAAPETPEVMAPVSAAEDVPVVEPQTVVDEGPVHRPLIRATLPRPEGQPPARPIPDFTVRHARNGSGFRDDRKAQRGGNWPQGNGSRPGRSGRQRPGRPGQSSGRPAPFAASGNRQDRPQQQQGRARSGRPPRPGKNRPK